MKLGILGGTFNPPHNGHINLAKQWGRRLDLDKFLMIPTGTPPHKAASDVSGEIRYEMCRIIAEQSNGLLEASDFEVRRKGKSYSVYTLAAMKELYPDCELYMIMGADMFMTLETWHDFDRLKTLATFCTMPRDGVTFEQLEQYLAHLESLGCHGTVVDVSEMEISSSQIRKLVADGGRIDDLVPAKIKEYIYSHGLYK